MKTLMFYELSADGLSRIQDNYLAHKARMEEFRKRGSPLMAGPYGNPPVGALAVFTNREAAEEFAKDDPFVANGIVGKCSFQKWKERLA